MNRRLVGLVLLTVTLAAQCSGQLRAPRITEHPSDVLVRKHEPATLNCKAEGKPSPVIDWFHNGQLVRGSANRMALPSGSLFFLHVIHSKREQDTGIYWCVARNELGKTRSRNASLEIAVLRDEFRTFPKNVKASIGESATLDCVSPKGYPEPSVRWKKERDLVNTNPGRIKITSSGSLIISNVQREDEGRYTCVAENMVGIRESPPALLSVHVRPFLVREPEHQTTLVGHDVTFVCNVGGEPPPLVTWLRPEGKLPTDRALLLDDHTLQIKNITPQDEGVYTCEAENPVGIISASASLIVHSRPKISSLPKNQRVGLNGIAKFECGASGNPAPSIFWSKEGNQMLMFPERSYGRFSVTKEGLLMISGVKKEDEGYYVCSVISVVGSTMVKVLLEVTTIPNQPPPIILRGPTNQTLPLHSSARLPCEAAGNPQPSVHWLVNSEPLPPNNHRLVILDSGSLQIDDLQVIDSGIYACAASSESGETSWSAYLAIESPAVPNIVFHRSPDPSTFPGPPSKPTIINTTETSITFSWKVNSKVGASALIGYTIEYFSGDLQTGWVVAAHRIPNDTFKVNNLKPDTHYVFLVRAENSHGLSLPSQPSEVAKTKGIENENELIYNLDDVRNRISSIFTDLENIKAASSTGCKLFWKIKGPSEFVEGFHIRFRDLSGNSLTYNLLTVLNTGSNSYLVKDLRKYTKYEFFLVPFYKNIEGPPSNTQTIQTLEDVPSAPPENINIEILNSSSATVYWSPPPPQHLNGRLNGFKVQIRNTKTNALFNVSTNSTNCYIHLHNLTEGAIYKVQVVAFTGAGTGPITKPVLVKIDTNALYPEVESISNFHDMLHQPWLIALIGIAICFLLSSLTAFLFIKRRLFWKKALGGHLSMAVHKSEDKRVGVSAREALWINQAWHPVEPKSISESKLINHQQASDYSNAPDYAEVDTHSMSIFYKKDSCIPAPYATTSLVNSNVNYLNNMMNEKTYRSEGNKKIERYYELENKYAEESLMHHLLDTEALSSPLSEKSKAEEFNTQKIHSTPAMRLDLLPNESHPPDPQTIRSNLSNIQSQGCFPFSPVTQPTFQTAMGGFFSPYLESPSDGRLLNRGSQRPPPVFHSNIPWSQQDPSNLLKKYPTDSNSVGHLPPWSEEPSNIRTSIGSSTADPLYAETDITRGLHSPEPPPNFAKWVNRHYPNSSSPHPPGSSSLQRALTKFKSSDNQQLYTDDLPPYHKPNFPSGQTKKGRLPNSHSSLSSLSSDSFLFKPAPQQAANV